MWKCPKCGREFKNREQDHYCIKPESIDQYIEFQDEAVRPYLQAFWKKRNLLQFAAFKNHIGLYPGPEAVEAFQERLTPYFTSKGAIRLPYQDPLPLELIGNIAKWCWEQYSA